MIMFIPLESQTLSGLSQAIIRQSAGVAGRSPSVPWSQVRLHLVCGQELQFPQPPAGFGQSAPFFELFSRSSSLLCHQLQCLV